MQIQFKYIRIITLVKEQRLRSSFTEGLGLTEKYSVFLTIVFIRLVKRTFQILQTLD